MAATEAKRLGLDETAVRTLANSYQQSLATIGGALGGLIAGSASGQNGTGSLVAAAQAGNTAMAVDVYNRQLHQKEIDLAKKYAKQVAKAGHITEEEAAARIERQILRWTNADTNKFDGGKVDELVLPQIGISGKDAALGIAWDYKNFATKNSAEYNNSSINQQNVVSYSPLITQVNLGKTPAQYEQQAHDGKVTALTAALCSVTLGGCAFMSGFNIGEGGTKIANGDTVAGSLQVGGGVLGLGGTIYAASKASIQTAAQVNAQGGTGGTGGTGALITMGANTEKDLAALTGLNGTGVYAPKTTGTSGGYTGLTVLDGNGNVIPNATLPSVGAKVGANRVAATEVRGPASGTGRSFWTNQTEFGGIKAFQRNDAFDPNLVTTWREGGQVVSGSNLERMATGRAPIGTDGKSVNLHHMLQSNDSAIAEMTQTFHQINGKVIHINPNTIPSGIDRPRFDIWRGDYWINRAATYGSQ